MAALPTDWQSVFCQYTEGTNSWLIRKNFMVSSNNAFVASKQRRLLRPDYDLSHRKLRGVSRVGADDYDDIVGFQIIQS